jgi:hypothetical protein
VSQVITFYSYKGGTGRSMALANIAWVLASTGKRVLAIDWDLEAPGLHRYFQPFLNDKELIGQESQGVIDMAIDFAVRAATPVREGEQLSDEWYELYADFPNGGRSCGGHPANQCGWARTDEAKLTLCLLAGREPTMPSG